MELGQWHGRHGAWPQSLAQVEAELGRELPRDPFGGGPLRYERRGEGWVLSSRGPEEGVSPYHRPEDLRWECP